MDVNSLILAGTSLGVMGLVFGASLAFASKKFAVEVDPRVIEVREAVPGANCGACGYPGCDGFANAVVKGLAPVNGCPVGGAPVASRVAQIMGVEAGATTKKVAKVKCEGHEENCSNRFDYDGLDSCVAANMLNGGPKVVYMDVWVLGHVYKFVRLMRFTSTIKGLLRLIQRSVPLVTSVSIFVQRWLLA